MNQHVLLALVLSYLWCLPGLYAVVRCKLSAPGVTVWSPLVCVTREDKVGCHSGLFGYELWNEEIFLTKGWQWKFLAKMGDSSNTCLLTSLSLGDRAGCGGQGVKSWKWGASVQSKCSVWAWKQYICLEPLSSWKMRSHGVSTDVSQTVSQGSHGQDWCHRQLWPEGAGKNRLGTWNQSIWHNWSSKKTYGN